LIINGKASTFERTLFTIPPLLYTKTLMLLGGDWVATIDIENVQPFRKDDIQQHQMIKMF
jgi:hypothetical protein